jgi:CubicO group peptidase (beta-lactamase class C family)
MLFRLILFALLAFTLVAAPPAPDPAKAGMDPLVLARIKPLMQSYVDRGLVSGTVTLVMRHGALSHLEAAGWQDLEAKKPMKADTLFQIMSMTKPVTGVAILMLADEGKLRLHDPVEKHLPEFRGQWMIETGDDKSRILKKPSRPITIRDLMTHTSGLIGNPPPGAAELLMKMDRSLAEATLLYSQTPLEFEPGSRWMYSNPGIATLGRIVEVVSGMPFEQFVESRICTPLGMTDTHIYLPREKRTRLAPVYTMKDGKIAKAGDGILAGDPMNYREGAKYSGPEYALHSTAWDLALFYQAMLQKGSSNGKRILSPMAVQVMSQVQTGDIKAGWDKGTGFGLTWEVVKDPSGSLTGLSKGAYGHGGAFGTFGWVDPERDLVGVFLIQFSGDRKDIRDAFIQIANASITE